MNCYNNATVQSDEDSGLCSQLPSLDFSVSPQSGTPPFSAGSVLLFTLLQANNSTFRVFTGTDLTQSDDDHMFPHSPSQGSNCSMSSPRSVRALKRKFGISPARACQTSPSLLLLETFRACVY